MGKVELLRFGSADDLAKAAAAAWFGQIKGSEHCAFSGGRIAEKFFDALTQGSRAKLNNLHYFWADERCVPPDHPDSNYRLMRERLLKPLGVPETQVHRIKGELDPALAAEEASREFSQIISPHPVLDFIFLGMGEDGHVASIFPGDRTVEQPSIFYRPVVAPKPPPHRVTITMHAILAAKNVWVMVSGPGKETALGKSLAYDPAAPLGQVLGGRDFTIVYTDTFAK